MKEVKVLVDANILVSASICYTCDDFGITHHFYVSCKSLINFFKKNIDRKIGFYTREVDETSRRVLNDAVLNTIREYVKNNPEMNEKNLLTAFSIIHSEALRRLEENKNYLIRETVNVSAVNKLISQVLLFFRLKIKNWIIGHNPKIRIANIKKNIRGKGWRMNSLRSSKIEEAKREFPHFDTLKRKFVDSGPDTEDMNLLSQAIYFRRLFKKKKADFYLASTDHHFIAINKGGLINDFIPREIEKKFGVKCVSPEHLLSVLKK